MNLDLHNQLELIFDAHILFMTIDRQSGVGVTSSFGSNIVSQLSLPTTHIKVRLVKRNIGTELHDPIHALDFTRSARVTSIRYEQRADLDPTPVYEIDIAIGDVEGLTKDLNEYCWRHFSEEFTKRLDKVLEEE